MRIAIVNLKGGVGKTTTAIHLATLLGQSARTLLVDTDPQASAWEWCHQVGDTLPFNTDLRPVQQLHRLVDDLMTDYDHLVVDTPPGHEPIVRSALAAVELAVVPIAPSTVDAARFGPTLDLLGQADSDERPLHYRVLLTKVRAGTRSAPDLRAELAALDLPLLHTEIPLRERYSRGFGLIPDEDGLTPYRAALDELATVGALR